METSCNEKKEKQRKKVAIVTGASSGMGREFVRAIARDYEKSIQEIWVIARRKERLVELQKELSGSMKLRLIALDITDDAAYEEYVSLLKKENPKVCILINSAGYGKIGNFQELSREDNLGMVKLNCEALVKVTYDTLEYMVKKGKIIQLASAASFLPQPAFAIYAASKSFVTSFSKALSWELSWRQITVTAVCPGPVKTEFFDIAEEKNSIALYKRLVMANPVKVVRKAMRDMRKGKMVSVYGITMNLFRLLCKLCPQEIIMNLGFKKEE